jgi:splicing factor U2AF subunit
VLTPAVTVEELENDEDYQDILEDMREEAGKFGSVVQVHIPRPPAPGAPPPPGLGKVILEFADPGAAMAARNALHGRKFGGQTVEALLMTDDDYKSFRWD